MPFEVSLNVLRLFSCKCMMNLYTYICIYIKHHALQAHSKFVHTYIHETKGSIHSIQQDLRVGAIGYTYVCTMYIVDD